MCFWEDCKSIRAEESRAIAITASESFWFGVLSNPAVKLKLMSNIASLKDTVTDRFLYALGASMTLFCSISIGSD